MKYAKQSGSAILYLIILIPVLVTIATVFTSQAVTSFRIARSDQYATHAQFAADAGLDKAMEEINLDVDWPGTGGEVVLHDDNDVCTTYQVLPVIAGNNGVVISIGRTYRRECSTSQPVSQVILNADLRSISSGDFSIVAGIGGLEMENHAKVLGGDIHTNGGVFMKNHAQIGLALAPVNLTVANQTCPDPPDSNYPRLCNLGENDDPIQIINDAHIYGDVKANHQFTTNLEPQDDTPEMSDPGLTSSSGVAVQSLPAHDRVAQINSVATTRTGADASCTTNGGAKIWLANTKITGNVTISGNNPNPCVVTILGDVWITGTLTVENGGKIVVGGALTERPDVMIDGRLNEFKNSALIEANLAGIGVQFVSYWSTNSCTYAEISPCSSISGSDLFDSKDEVTIKLDNSASGAKAIFYAKFTELLIANSGDIGALVGQTVHLQNSGTVTFGSSVTGGLSFWVVDGYRRTF